jgi:hypothetical protein
MPARLRGTYAGRIFASEVVDVEPTVAAAPLPHAASSGAAATAPAVPAAAVRKPRLDMESWDIRYHLRRWEGRIVEALRQVRTEVKPVLTCAQ